jgi:hypothetical protein
MKTSLLFLIPAFLFLSLTSCTDKNQPSPECGDYVFIGKNFYNNGPDDPFSMEDVSLEGDCLTLKVQYGGGCGGATFTLVDKSDIERTSPPTRYIRLALKDQDNCEALITEDKVYDLSPLQVETDTQIKLVLQNWEGEIVYSY